MRILDIGCGRKKLSGAIGLDFSPLSDADIVVDLNADPFPFVDSSFDFLYSSHALEHLSLDGFWNVMREAYRVLKPDAQFMVVVPYFYTSANWANPFHNNLLCFNEHTFRFLSSEFTTTALAPDDYQSPSCPQWGLRYSANAELGVEFRVRRIDFYYFPEFRALSESAKREARSSRANVVDQISYCLQAVKPCPSRPETGPSADGVDPHGHIATQIDYLREQVEFLEAMGVAVPERDLVLGYLRALERRTELYFCDGVIIPASQLVYMLDASIQRLRALIDEVRAVVASNS